MKNNNYLKRNSPLLQIQQENDIKGEEEKVQHQGLK